MTALPLHAQHYIDGKWMDGAARIDVTSPIDGTSLGSVPAGSSVDVDAAVAAARGAFASWSALAAQKRVEYLQAFSKHINANARRFAEIESLDTGFLLSASESVLVRRASINFKYYADFALRADAKPDVIEARGAANHVQRRAAGVVAIITPWNSPLVLATWKIAAALASGNTVVLKPAELAPMSCVLLAQAAEAIGLPPGVLNVVHGTGAQAGSALAAHTDIDRLAFTGSTATAQRIGAACAQTITPVSFELGGKSPLVICEGADLDAACEQVIHQFNHAGQICAAGTRVIVEKSIEAQLRERVLDKISQLVVGDPRLPGTAVGPIISETQMARVEGLVQRAIAGGAQVLCGGKRAQPGSLYFQPTLLTGVASGSEIQREEVFGPVLLWSSFKDDADAVAQANDAQYGLGAYLWCKDGERAMRMASMLRAGTVWVNGSTRDLDAPFGGTGKSGIGREGGMWGWEFFTDVINVAVKHGTFASAPHQQEQK